MVNFPLFRYLVKLFGFWYNALTIWRAFFYGIIIDIELWLIEDLG